jgi:hypothetical protein
MAICQPIFVEKITVERFFCIREIDSVLDGQGIVLVPGRAVWMVLKERTNKHHALMVFQRVSEACLLEVLPKAIRGFRFLEFSARRGNLMGQSEGHLPAPIWVLDFTFLRRVNIGICRSMSARSSWVRRGASRF